MKFGRIPVDTSAVGAILGHSVSHDRGRLHKGHVLIAADIEALARAGIREIIAARFEPGDVPEDEAARRIAEAAAGAGVKVTAAFTGRANLYAEAAGVLLLDDARIDALNAIDEAITIATLPRFELVNTGDMLATVKVIPFSAPEASVESATALAGESGPAIHLAAFQNRKLGLIITRQPDTKASVVTKTETVVRERVATLGSSLTVVETCNHHETEIASCLRTQLASGIDIALVFGASAIVDRRDVIPSGIVAAGGKVEHFGMPVDPGNLLLLGRVGTVPVIGVPGCARSPKLNGFDWVLRRLCAGLAVTRNDFARMGVGGLLKEITSRPLPREKAVSTAEPTPRMPKIAALILAAGRSTRMGPDNKLLKPVAGKPMVVHAAEAALSSSARPVIAVLGHEAAKVKDALKHLNIATVDNPHFAEGLATSLRAGLAALPADCDGVLVCLGDMPSITGAQLDQLIAAFNPVEGRSICVPTFEGKRGNPVLWGRAFFLAMSDVKGDVGARHLIGENADQVREVAMTTNAVLLDIDTPAAYGALIGDK